MINNQFDHLKFIKSLPKHLKYRVVTKGNIEKLNQTLLQNGQALYAIDYTSNKIIYQRNIEKVLGYNQNEFNVSLVHDKLLHPKQKTIVGLIIESIITKAINGELPIDATFSIIYKLKHKRLGYRTILRQTGGFNGRVDQGITAIYSIITDLTDIIETDKVDWKLEGADSMFEDILNQKIIEMSKSIFTSKELEIIKYLSKGLSSKEISKINGSSKHTVDTHRRNLLRKTNSKNTRELLNFVDSVNS